MPQLRLEAAAPALPLLHQASDVLNLEDGARVDGRDEQETAWLRRVAVWSRDYLTKPHPDVGRAGSVCPWVEKSIQRRRFYLTLMPEAHLRVGEVVQALHLLRKHFLEMEPTDFSEAQFKTIVTAFTGLPESAESEFMRVLHDRLKPFFVKEGLMLGEFYATCPKTGLRNSGWYPLRSSPPLLVIRSMVRPDIAFLYDKEEFVLAYLSRFQKDGCAELNKFIERQKAHLPPENVDMLQGVLRQFQESKAA